MKNKNSESTGRVLPATINIHLTRNCNFGCRYCYAEFKETGSSRIRREQMLAILDAIAKARISAGVDPRKVNFAGGEPFLHPDLCEFIAGSKNLGLKTSIVSNGSLLNDAVVSRLSGHLDILALSIDSLSSETNRRIGRCGRSEPPNVDQYQRI